jgi:hydroxypyruvate isomerase
LAAARLAISGYSPSMNRRDLLLATAALPMMAPLFAAAAAPRPRAKLRQGVMQTVWGASPLSFEQRCEILARIGYVSLDLPTEQQLPVMKKYNLLPAVMVGTGTTMQNGVIRKDMHDVFEPATRAGIDLCARAGCPNLVAFPGMRQGMSREEGADNAVAFFNRVKGYAEQKNVTLCMEITNSKNPEDQRTDMVFDHVAWGFDICKRVNSPRVQILYDIYHVAVADGNVVRSLRENLDWICHIHVAGNPGRHELDETQELNFRFIANAIADTGYSGFVAHEWRPSPGRDPVASLEQCFRIMDV